MPWKSPPLDSCCTVSMPNKLVYFRAARSRVCVWCRSCLACRLDRLARTRSERRPQSCAWSPSFPSTLVSFYHRSWGERLPLTRDSIAQLEHLLRKNNIIKHFYYYVTQKKRFYLSAIWDRFEWRCTEQCCLPCSIVPRLTWFNLMSLAQWFVVVAVVVVDQRDRTRRTTTMKRKWKTMKMNRSKWDKNPSSCSRLERRLLWIWLSK